MATKLGGASLSISGTTQYILQYSIAMQASCDILRVAARSPTFHKKKKLYPDAGSYYGYATLDVHDGAALPDHRAVRGQVLGQGLADVPQLQLRELELCLRMLLHGTLKCFCPIQTEVVNFSSPFFQF